MPETAPETLSLQNGVVALSVARQDGRIVSWTETATGASLAPTPIGLEIVSLSPGLGGYLALRDKDSGELLLYDPLSDGPLISGPLTNDLLGNDQRGPGGVAVQMLYRLEPGSNLLTVEVALSNRTRDAIPLRLRWHGQATFDPPTFAPTFAQGGEAWEDALSLAGRTVVSFTVSAAAFGSDASRASNSEAGIGWDDAAVTLRVARPLVAGRLFLGTGSGETLEAPVTLTPERALLLPLGGARPVAVVLRDESGHEILRNDASPPATVLPDQPDQPDRPGLVGVAWANLDLSVLARLARDPAVRHLAALERARRAALAGEDAKAESALEDALLWNADDPLVWWAKAVVQRRIEPGRDRTEWLNARFLRPLEPLVAAEALLNQEPEESEAGNPLMGLVAAREVSAAMCVAAYIEAGYVREAIALAERILAVRDWRRVRLLAAGLYLVHSRMELQAAEHYAAAARAESESESLEPGIEAELLRSVRARFATPKEKSPLIGGSS